MNFRLKIVRTFQECGSLRETARRLSIFRNTGSWSTTPRWLTCHAASDLPTPGVQVFPTSAFLGGLRLVDIRRLIKSRTPDTKKGRPETDMAETLLDPAVR